MRASPLRVASSLVTLVLATSIGNAAAVPERAFVELLAPLAADHDGPGCSIAASLGDGDTLLRQYGFANLGQRTPIDAATVFHAASIAKQFTAFSIGLLAEEGKLSLDDSLRKHLPEMPEYADEISLAQLIHHTSGLREQYHLLHVSGWRHGDVFRQEDVLHILRSQRSTNHPPGEEVVYGNSAYILLAEVVHRVSGQTFPEFANEHIFRPLGMAHTRFRSHHAEIVQGLAEAYSLVDGQWRINVPRFDHYGSTNLLTTPSDLLRWQQNLQDGRLGGKRLNAWMQRSGRLNDGTKIGYGGGLRLGDHRGLAMVSHDGLDAGYRAQMLLIPSRDLRVAVLCNSTPADPTRLGLDIADALLGSTKGTASPAPMAKVESPYRPAQLAGVYWSPLADELVRLEARDGELFPAGASAALRPLGDGAYGPPDTSHRWQFGHPGTGTNAATTLEILDYWPTPRHFLKLDNEIPAAAQMREMAGHYHSEEVGAEAHFKLEGSTLVLSLPRLDPIPLTAVGGDRFSAGFASVNFTRDASGKIQGMQMTTRRLRRLHWQRLPEQP